MVVLSSCFHLDRGESFAAETRSFRRRLELMPSFLLLSASDDANPIRVLPLWSQDSSCLQEEFGVV